MFQRLHLVLLFAVLVVIAFFVVSSMSFSGRLAEDYVAKTWRLRWWLLDGWLALLYFVCFIAIAFIWRPSANNRRLAMSDEVAQDEEDAEDYDLEAIQSRTQARDDDDEDDAATLVGGRRGHHRSNSLSDDHVVFEIGDEDDDDDAKKRRLSGENLEGVQGEREGLMR
jgi:flagellar biosynthesis/type III secretory pathway M-ring protein FliF/YscJ